MKILGELNGPNQQLNRPNQQLSGPNQQLSGRRGAGGEGAALLHAAWGG